MGILNGNPKNEPMHYGEVFSTWNFLSMTKGALAGKQTLLNHAGDTDLQHLIEEAIQQAEKEIDQLEMLLKENGVGLPPTPPGRPKANLEDIPVGARLQDSEITASLSAEIAGTLVACSQIIGQAIREDIAAMFGKIHNQNVILGGRFLRLNKEKAG